MFHVALCTEAVEAYVYTSFIVSKARCRENNGVYMYKVAL